MLSPGQQFQHSSGIAPVSRFTEDFVINNDSCVGAQYPGAGLSLCGDCIGLVTGSSFRESLWFLAFNRMLAHLAGDTAKRYPGQSQKLLPARRF